MDVRAGFHASARWQRHVESSVGGEGGGGMREEGEDAALWWSGEMYAKVTRAKSISVITVIILGFVRHFPIIPRLSLLPHHQTLRAPHQTHSPHHHSLRAHHPPRRSFTTKLHTRSHLPLSAHTFPTPSQIRIPASPFLRVFPCIYVARYLKIFLPHLMER